MNTTTDTDTDTDTVTIDEMKTNIADLRRRRDLLLALDKDQADLAEARTAQERATEWKEALSGLGKACRTAIKKQMAAAADVINQTVAASLPAAWEFELVLADGHRDAFRPGLWQDRGGRLLTTVLSGSEDAAVTGAFSAVAAKSRPGTLSVMSPDDVGWDGISLFDNLKGFEGYPGQVIVCSTTWPARKDPDGEIVDDIPAAWDSLIMPDGLRGS